MPAIAEFCGIRIYSVELNPWSEGMESPRVTEVKVVRPYVLRLVFSDGTRREVDLEPELHGGVFEALKDAAVFAQAFVEGVGVAWPNGASFAPEYLYSDAKSPARA